MKCAFLLLLTIFVGPCIFAQDARILNGHDVDTLRRFPHHVTIRPRQDTYPGTSANDDQYCSGSIISDKWILTSMQCVEGGSQFDIYFHRKYAIGGGDSFQVTVRGNAVHRYPTGYDDLALIRLPVSLIFDEEITPVHITSKGISMSGLVVMPGFNEPLSDSYANGDQYDGNTHSLQYGMFAVVSNQMCKNYYGSDFDEYIHFCVMGWGNNNETPCNDNRGGGLITGWPRQPELVGVFSRVSRCEEGIPSIFVDISKYMDWIAIETGNDIEKEWPYYTMSTPNYNY